jgi:dTDP-4-amino-4,6-dideoxygalactose transaminase
MDKDLKASDISEENLVFTKQFTQQEPIPEEAISRAVEVMRTGRLHRYNTAFGETSEVSLLEKEFAEYMGARYCAAFSSCGSSIYIALKSVGISPGDKVLCNAFTLAPVPGAISNAGAEAVLVEIKQNYTIDCRDLEAKAEASGAKFLLLSHMRGHIADMDEVMAVCERQGLILVEDCAHTAGCHWGDVPTGRFGKAGCFSTQTYKHMNSGEGGLLITDDDDTAAKAILYSGSYMLYDRHISRPSEEVFARFKKIIPNFSLRMSNLQGALLRPQLRMLDHQCERWNSRYKAVEKVLLGQERIYVPERPPKEHYVGSSFQFSLKEVSREQVQEFIAECGHRGVEIKWFGWKEPKGFTSSYDSWQYLGRIPDLPKTREILDSMCDFRIPLTFDEADCELIGKIICQVALEVFQQ